MENELDIKPSRESEKKITAYLKSLERSEAALVAKTEVEKKIRSNELFQMSEEHPMDELAGVCIEGVHYYDFKNIHFINSTGMASLIDLLKCLLVQGVKIQLVNVNDSIKNKIKSLGLENILNCS